VPQADRPVKLIHRIAVVKKLIASWLVRVFCKQQISVSALSLIKPTYSTDPLPSRHPSYTLPYCDVHHRLVWVMWILVFQGKHTGCLSDYSSFFTLCIICTSSCTECCQFVSWSDASQLGSVGFSLIFCPLSCWVCFVILCLWSCRVETRTYTVKLYCVKSIHRVHCCCQWLC